MDDLNNLVSGNPSEDTSSTDQNLSKPLSQGKNKGHMVIISIIVLILIIALIIFVYMPQLKTYTSTTATTTRLLQTTTIASSSQNLSFWNASASRILNLSIINNTFGPNSSDYYSSKENHTLIKSNYSCEGTRTYIGLYSISNFDVLSNTSLQGELNPKIPFIIFLKTSDFNTTQNLTSQLMLCPNILIFTNSSYVQSINSVNVTSQIGAPAELYIVSNFTPLGLGEEGLSNNTPPISIYLLGLSYKNVVIKVGAYYLTKYANETQVLNLAKSTYSNILNYYNKHG